MGTKEEFQKALNDVFHEHEAKGDSYVDVRAGDLHRRVGGYPGPGNRMPTCCNVMNENIRLGDKVVYKPPKGKGPRLEIRYVLPREQVNRGRNIKVGESTEVAVRTYEGKVLVFSPCSSSKWPEPEELPPDFNPVKPECYLESPHLVDRLLRIRQQVLNDSRAQAQKEAKETIAFDLYMRSKSQAYKGIRESHGENLLGKLRGKLLSSDEIQWFFLSGGYGVVHALERAKDYNASFSWHRESFYTAGIWQKAELSAILDAIIKKLSPSRIYVFGTPRYLKFIEKTNFYKERMKQDRIKVFEGFGKNDRNVGLRYLAEVMKELAEAVIHDDLNRFDHKHSKRYDSNKN